MLLATGHDGIVRSDGVILNDETMFGLDMVHSARMCTRNTFFGLMNCGSWPRIAYLCKQAVLET